MQTNQCSHHHIPQTLYDLNIHQLVCQKCALFQSPLRHHAFIDAASLPQHAQQMQELFIRRVEKVMPQKGDWTQMQRMAREQVAKATQEIHEAYQERHHQLEIEQDQEISTLRNTVGQMLIEAQRSLSLAVSQEIREIEDASQQLQKNQEAFVSIVKQLSQPQIDSSFEAIENQLELAQFELRHKLLTFTQPALPGLNKKASSKEQLLLEGLQHTQIEPTPVSSLKDSRISRCLTQVTEASQETSEVDCETTSKTSNDSSKSTLRVTSKALIKGLFLKNTIRTVDMSGLDMNCREVLEAIKRCSSSGNFVSKIDLSGNQINARLLGQLRRQKLSRYLKTIVMRGVVIDGKQLKREGLVYQARRDGGRIQMGKVTIEC